MSKREKITVKRGSSIVTIRPIDNNGYDHWSVEYYDAHKKLKRIKRSTLEDARIAADQVADRIAQGDTYRPLKREEVQSYLTAIGELPEGKMLHEVVREWKALSVAKPSKDLVVKSFDSAWKEMVDFKRADGCSSSYLQDLETRLKFFGKSYTGNVNGLRGEFIDRWLRGLDVSPKTRNNIRALLSAFITFCKQRKYIPKEWNELDEVAIARTVEMHPVEILTPEECGKLLKASSEEYVPFLALGMFAGIRHAEIARMEWSAINFETKWITLSASIVKSHRSATRRLVPLLPNLQKWLEPLKSDGRIPYKFPMIPILYEIAKKARLEWKHNSPRHSFISNRLAIVQNVNQVALECGNSPSVIFKHYRELTTPKQAEEYFNVFP